MQVGETVFDDSPATAAPAASEDYTAATAGVAIPPAPTNTRLSTVVGWSGGAATTLSGYRLEPNLETPAESRWILEEQVALDGTFSSYEFSGYGSRFVAVFDAAPDVVTYRFEAG